MRAPATRLPAAATATTTTTRISAMFVLDRLPRKGTSNSATSGGAARAAVPAMRSRSGYLVTGPPPLSAYHGVAHLSECRAFAILRGLIIPTGKRKGRHPSVACIYRAPTERAKREACPEVRRAGPRRLRRASGLRYPRAAAGCGGPRRTTVIVLSASHGFSTGGGVALRCSGRRLGCFRLRLDRVPPAALGVCGDLGHPWLEAAGTRRPVSPVRAAGRLSARARWAMGCAEVAPRGYFFMAHCPFALLSGPCPR